MDHTDTRLMDRLMDITDIRITGRPLESGSVTGGVAVGDGAVIAPSSTGMFTVATTTGVDSSRRER